MRKQFFDICSVVFVAGMLLAHATPRAAFAADSTQPAPAAHDDAYWKAVQDRLGSEDPKIRAAAQKELQDIPLEDRAKLQELLDKSTDDEVKARLSARIAEIDEQIATNPSPISIEVKDGSLSEVVHALHAATGVTMTSWPPDNDGQQHGTFTLSAKKKPFWEIFTLLSAQHPLMVQRNDRFQIMQQEPGLCRCVPAAAAGFFLFPGNVIRSKAANLQAAAGEEVGDEQLTFNYTIAADPRIKILRYSQPVLTDVTDDAGNELMIGVPHGGRQNMQQAQRGEALFQGYSELQLPDNLGKKIVSAKGLAHFLVQIAQEYVDVPDPAAKLNQPLAVGPRTVTITKFQPHDQTVEFNVTASNLPRARRNDASAIIHLQIRDSRDQVVWETEIWGGNGGSIGTGGFKGPFNLRFSVPSKTKDLPVEFEMKDIPLP